jgi:hypothetical protein
VVAVFSTDEKGFPMALVLCWYIKKFFEKGIFVRLFARPSNDFGSISCHPVTQKEVSEIARPCALLKFRSRTSEPTEFRIGKAVAVLDHTQPLASCAVPTC